MKKSEYYVFSNSCKHSLLSYLRKSANILCFKALLFTGLSCQEPVSISFLTTIQKVLEHYFNCMIYINKNESFLPYHLNQKDLNPERVFGKKTILALEKIISLWRIRKQNSEAQTFKDRAVILIFFLF